MHVRLQLDPVTERGIRVESATHWPIFFVSGVSTLQWLSGDLGSTDWLYTPGAAIQPTELVWRRAVADRGEMLRRARIGFGLVYSAGGAGSVQLEIEYQALAATVHALVLSHAAEESGVQPLLAAFGGREWQQDRGPSAVLDRLRNGVDPDQLEGQFDRGLVEQFAALRSIEQALSPLTPGVVGPGAVGGGGLDPGRDVVVGPPLESRISAPKKPESTSRLESGSVVAVTLQTWRVDEIPVDRPLDFSRSLPTRGAKRASLTLSGRLSRGE